MPFSNNFSIIVKGNHSIKPEESQYVLLRTCTTIDKCSKIHAGNLKPKLSVSFRNSSPTASKYRLMTILQQYKFAWCSLKTLTEQTNNNY